MSLQNRVNPKGEILSVQNRGNLMGNRGILHDEHKNIVRSYKLKAWLICLLKYKNNHRNVMSPNTYTELFFLDEATAFSAGHRPCALCQRQRYNEFKSFWQKANGKIKSIKELDVVLHEERKDENRQLACDDFYPDGTFIERDSVFYILWKMKPYKWSFLGYEKADIKVDKTCKILTPKSIVKSFEMGFVPKIYGEFNENISI